ncbi:MAG: glycosyltransferase family 87 protein [Tatlockia sp.]|jgi:hypothetical protein
MNSLKILSALALIALYCLLFFILFTNLNLVVDFTSFYSALANLAQGKSPYDSLFSVFFPINKPLSANLNPPFVFFLFKPFALMPYPKALFCWTLLSFFAGLSGAMLAFYHAFSRVFFSRHWLILMGVYLSLFSTLMNFSIGQAGLLLLFLIMLGYHFYLGEHNVLAGILWGLAAALKFFPALLFVFAIKQKRPTLALFMVLTLLLAFGIPLLCYGTAIYGQYLAMMAKVFWYGDNWNGSLYGFLFRFIANRALVDSLYLILLGLMLCWYLKKMRLFNADYPHQPFCLTLVMMLLMSPLGWLYYFPLLLFPLAIAFSSKALSLRTALCTLLCLFLLNLPQGYLPAPKMPHSTFALLLASCYFYGLLLLAYLTSSKEPVSIQYKTADLYWPVFAILSFGLLMTLCQFVWQMNALTAS